MFVDECGVCQEPATMWLADRPGEAWCQNHAPVVDLTGPRRSCRECAYTSCERDQLEEHIYGHVHAWRQEARLTTTVLAQLKAATREAALMLHGAARHMDEAAS